MRAWLLGPVFVLFLLAGCTTVPQARVIETDVPLTKAVTEADESRLLDVWIEQFDPGKLPEDEKKARGLSADIRAAEARFIPVQLRGVMERTGYWGAVRVVPRDTSGAELRVKGTILVSDGAQLALEISALDATGREWFRRRYEGRFDAQRLQEAFAAGDEPYDAVYHAIANDLAESLKQRSDDDLRRIRQIAALRFAADMAPDAFAGYLARDDDGHYVLQRLPAADDPMYRRVMAVRARDNLLVDTLNGHYDNYQRTMQPSYLEWRKARTAEAAALREVERKANTRKALGIAAIVGAIAIEALGGPDTSYATGTLRDVMVLGGIYAIKRGMDLAEQTSIHKEAIEELGASFSAEAKPLVVEVEGQTHELTGSAEVQYAQWRTLLRRIYAAETGLPAAD